MKKIGDNMKNILFLVLCVVLLGFGGTASPDTKKLYNNGTIKVAVIDTGFDFESTWPKHKFDKWVINRSFFGPSPQHIQKPRLCNEGHKDFTGEGLSDRHGHGTHIAGIIGKHARNSNYCLVIIKYYSQGEDGSVNLKREIQAFQYALNIKVDIINFSGGGPSPSYKEHEIVKKLLARGTKLVFAAGNENENIDIPENKYYPASYSPKIFTVGSYKRNLTRARTSNYGKSVNYWEIGDNVLSLLPGDRIGYMGGTSQATAVKTGKIIKSWVHN